MTMTRRLLLLSGLAIFAVVCNHAVGWGYTAMFWWTDRYLPVSVPYFEELRGLTYYALLIIKRLTVFAVPAFLFISGYFAAYTYSGEESRKIWKAVGTRVKHLLIPYAIWSMVIFIVDVVQGIVHTPLEYVRRLTFGEATGAYFYVPVISGLYLLSPLLVRAAKARPLATLFFSLMLQLSTIAIDYLVLFGVTSHAVAVASRLTTQYMLPRLVFFFVFGIVLKVEFRNFSAWLAPYRYYLFGSLVVLGAVAVVEPEMLYLLTGENWLFGYILSTDLYATAFILCFLSLKKMSVPREKLFLEFGKSSYGIYLVHPIVLEATARLLRWFIPGVLAHQVLFLPLLVVAGIGIPFLLVVGISKTPANRYSRYVFG